MRGFGKSKSLRAVWLLFAIGCGGGHETVGQSTQRDSVGQQLVVVYPANDGSRNLCVTSSANGQDFSTGVCDGGQQLGGAPALTSFGSTLLLTYAANDGSNAMYTTSSTDGVHFGNIARQTSNAFGGPPSLYWSNDAMFVAYPANDSSALLYIADANQNQPLPPSFGTGSSFPQVEAYQAPLLTCVNNNCFLLVEEEGLLTCNIGASGCYAAEQWSGPLPTKLVFDGGGVETMGYPLAAAVLDTASRGLRLYVLTGQQGSFDGHWQLSLTSMDLSSGANPYNFDTPLLLPAWTSAAAMTAYNGQLYIVYQAADSSQAMYVAVTDGQRVDPPNVTTYGPYQNNWLGGPPAIATLPAQ
jgi:hypothetical protein